ncbi:MAG: type II secretion system F family protein [Coriobacteriia bacterium]|nr:type II secretion system F family protein [Coriobacteriia bacterium]
MVRILVSQGMVASAESVLSLILGTFLVCLVLGSLASCSLVLGLASSSCLVLAAGFWSKHQEERIADSFKEDIPEALRTMQACFSVGHSLEQTFDAVAKRDTGPLSLLFAQSAGILKSGGTVQESLDCLKRDSGNSELSFLATALEIQHRTGSSMQQVLEVAREAIEGDLEMTRHLRTQTAQARLSARIVTVMPFALVALFSLISEGFLSPFFESLPGMVMLVCALGMQLAGVLLVRRMLNVEVS